MITHVEHCNKMIEPSTSQFQWDGMTMANVNTATQSKCLSNENVYASFLVHVL